MGAPMATAVFCVPVFTAAILPSAPAIGYWSISFEEGGPARSSVGMRSRLRKAYVAASSTAFPNL